VDRFREHPPTGVEGESQTVSCVSEANPDYENWPYSANVAVKAENFDF
jgi:hypothetical protein